MLFTLVALLLVGPRGLEPRTKGFRFVLLSQLPGLCLHHMLYALRWVPSSLYTFNSTFILKLGSALAWVLLPLAFTEFDTIHTATFVIWCTTLWL